MAARLTAYIVALIVGVTLIAGLIVGAQRPDDGPVDVMVVNGRVYTADGEGTTAEAVAIQGNKILRVGTTREIQRLRRAQTIVIDAKGGTVLPGFIETDARLFDVGPTQTEPIYGPSPMPTREEELETLRATMASAHRRGITSIQTIGGFPHELDFYDELRREGALSFRVYGALAISPRSSDAQVEAFDELRARYPDDPLLKAGAAEISLVDEQVDAHGLNRLVAALDKRNWQIVIRANDDRGLAMALEAYRHAIAVNPVPERGRRHRIEVEALEGPVDFAPFDESGVLYTAPGEPLSILDAIEAYTRSAAWMSFDEHRKGSLGRDMLADVIVLSKDVLARPTGRLSEADVSVTIFDGKVVFQKAPDAGN